MKIKKDINSQIFSFVIYFFSGLFALICLVPFWLVISGSITDELSILQNGYQFIPDKLSFEAYKLIFTGSRVAESYRITIIVTVLGTLISLLVTSMLAYALASRDIKYGRFLTMFVVITMFFSISGGLMVPWYILCTQYLHLQNTIWGMIIPYSVNAWYCLIMRNFFRGIPPALTEAARIDGASEIRILRSVILPLSTPIMATFTLFYALQYWNDWWLALMLIEDSKMFPLQFLLRSLISNLMNAVSSLNPNISVSMPPSYSVRMAITVVTVGPIVFLYPFIQKYFVKGLTVGGVKG